MLDPVAVVFHGLKTTTSYDEAARKVQDTHGQRLVLTPRGEAVWISSRDANRVSVIDSASFATLATLPIDAPSGIFFASRAARLGL